MLYRQCLFLLFLSISPFIHLNAFERRAFERHTSELERIYQVHCAQPSDINEHLPDLRKLASECSSVTEIGVRTVVSTWALLQGLADAKQPYLSYLGIDLENPPHETWQKVERLTREANISCRFWQANDMQINIPAVDMLFIDSLHTYCHLTYELEKFSPQVRKYIAMHDTSEPWGTLDDNEYYGNYAEYDASIDRSKRGLWPAVEDFLKRHPEWTLHYRKFNNHGFTVLKRAS